MNNNVNNNMNNNINNNNMNNNNNIILGRLKNSIKNVTINEYYNQLNPMYEYSMSLKKHCIYFINRMENNTEYNYKSINMSKDFYKNKPENFKLTNNEINNDKINRYSSYIPESNQKLTSLYKKLDNPNKIDKHDKYKKQISEINSKSINDTFYDVNESQQKNIPEEVAKRKIDKDFNDQMRNILDCDVSMSKKQGFLMDIQNVVYQDDSYLIKSDVQLKRYTYDEIQDTKHMILKNTNNNDNIEFKIKDDYYLDAINANIGTLNNHKQNEELSFKNTKFIKIDMNILCKIVSFDTNKVNGQ